MAGSILVLGATGNVGGATLAALRASGVDAIAFARDGRRAAALLGPDQAVRLGDLGDRDSIAAALDGIDRLLLSSGNDPALREQQLNVVAAVAESNVQRVVKISGSPVAVGADSPSKVGRDHAELEDALRAIGRESVAIRPNVFMQTFLAQTAAISNGALPGPEGARVSFIDVHDVGAVAAVALTSDPPPAEVLELTGPEALTWYDVAEELSGIVGHDVTHYPTPTDVLAETLRALGQPDWAVQHTLEMSVLLREPKAAEVTDTVEHLTGRPPASLAHFLVENAGAFAQKAVV